MATKKKRPSKKRADLRLKPEILKILGPWADAAKKSYGKRSLKSAGRK
jgi:hypothetical protein